MIRLEECEMIGRSGNWRCERQREGGQPFRFGELRFDHAQNKYRIAPHGEPPQETLYDTFGDAAMALNDHHERIWRERREALTSELARIQHELSEAEETLHFLI